MGSPRATRYAESLLDALTAGAVRLECRVEGVECIIDEEEIDKADLPAGMKRPDAIIVMGLKCGNRRYRICFVIEYAGGKRGQPKDFSQASAFEAAGLLTRDKCGVEAQLYIPVLHMHGTLRAPTRRPPVRVSCDTRVNRANVRVLLGWLRGFLGR